MTVHDPYRWNDPRVDEARTLLERVLNDVHWRSSQRIHKRRIVEDYTRRISWIGILVGILFFLLLVAISFYKVSGAPFSGIWLVLVSGLLGASFSILTNTSTRDVEVTIEELLRTTSTRVAFLRLCVGAVGAVILYFFFEADLIEGVLFPDLKKLGFASIGPDAPNAAVLGDLLARVAADLSYAAERAKELVAAIEAEAAALQESGQSTGTGSDAGPDTRALLAQAREQEAAIRAVLDRARAASATEESPLTGTMLAAVYEIRSFASRVLDDALSLSTELRETGQLLARQERIVEALESAAGIVGGDVYSRLGDLVPNAELSKLMIWSFLAGFSEQLVARMLRRVEAQSRTEGTAPVQAPQATPQRPL
jgi:energy-coupling factor transporter transmembrane protein EcfT